MWELLKSRVPRSALAASALALFCLAQGVPHLARSDGRVLAQVHTAPARTSSLAPHRPGEVLLRFADAAPPAERAAVLRALGVGEMKRLGAGPAGLVGLRGISVQQALEAFSRHPAVAYIEPNYILSAQVVPDDPGFPLQWGMFNLGQTGGTVRADIQAREAWDVFTGSGDVVVAVLDSGIDRTHPDLAPNIFVNAGEIAGNGIDDDGNGFIDDTSGWNFVERNNDPTDDSGHGTHVSGIIGAVGNNGTGVAGTTWAVKLLPLRFLNAGGFGATAQAVEAIDYAIAMEARIINASWGNPGFTVALREAIERAGDAGILFVAASGNANPALDLDVRPFYPASYPLDNIVTVAASDHNDELWQFSNFGDETVDIAAPGVNIFSTLPGDYGFLSGTSMAAPHVSGALALLLGRFPALDLHAARALLLARADVRPTLLGTVIAGARLNALRPIAIVDTTSPAAIDTLSIGEVDGGRIDLEWIATGDDGDDGQANRYDVRYSTTPIDPDNVAEAVRIVDTPEPAPSGTPERLRVGGLQFATTYYFAVRALDELGNVAPLSNVPSARTLTPPVAVVQPLELSDTLEAGRIAEHIVRVENDGEAEYIFDTVVRRPQAGASAAALPRSAGGAGAEDLRVLILGSGTLAQDVLGELAAFPELAPVDLFDATSFTPLLEELLPYHAVIVSVNLPFLNRGGVGDVLADYVDAGGGVVLTLASQVQGWQLEGRFRSGGYYPVELSPDPTASADLGPYDATHPIMLGVVEAEGRQLAVHPALDDAVVVAEWSNGAPLVVARDRIVSLNVSVLNGDFWSGDIPRLLVNAAYWVSGAISWASVAPAGGVVAPGRHLDLSVTFDATRLIAGDYRAEVVLRGNDPERPAIAVSADLLVSGTPDIFAQAEPLDAGAVFVGASAEVRTILTNRGTAALTVSGIATDRPEFGVEGAGFVLEARHSRTIPITFAPTAPGPVRGALFIDSDDPDTPRAEVELWGEGQGPPGISLSPAEVTAALQVGERRTVELRIDNFGASDLELEIRLEREEATFTIEENFEDGDMDGWFSAGLDIGGVTDAVAARGTRYSYHESFALFGHLNGIYRTLGQVRPGYIGVHVRSGSTERSDAFFVVRDSLAQDVIWFFAGATGEFYVNADVGGHESFRYQAETWYHIEFKNIDFQLRRFDYYIDGALIQARIPFRSAATEIDRLDLYSFQSGAQAWWDEIFVSSDDPVNTVALDRAIDRVPGRSSLSLPVTLDASRVIGGEYRTRIVIDTNVPSAPRVVVPVQVSVTGVPRIRLTPATVDFGPVFVGQDSSRTVGVINDGTDVLRVEGPTIDHADFSAATNGFAVEAGGRHDIPLVFRPSAAGPAAATLTLPSNDPGSPAATLPLAAEGLIAPQAEVSPGEIQATLSAGEVALRGLTLNNTGGQPLLYTMTAHEAGGGPPADSVAIFSDDVEAGSLGWTTEVYSGANLWHRTTTTSNSAQTAWWCGIEGQDGYDNGERVATALISPPLDLRSLAPPATLRFAENFETEPTYDGCLVDLSTDGGRTWVALRGAYGSAPSGSTGGWRLATLDLSPYLGQIVRVRFYFETQDGVNNQGAGWFVDDVRVLGGTAPWLRAVTAGGTLPVGQSTDLEIALAVPALSPTDRYDGRIRLHTNHPFDPELEVPVTLDVLRSPRIALPGQSITLDSGVDLDGGLATHHRLAADRPPAGAGEVTLVAHGRLGPGSASTLSAEAAVVGVTDGSGEGCGSTTLSSPLSGSLLHALAEDGSMELEVRSSPAVGSDCPVNRHELVLSYRAAREELDLGEVALGAATSRSLAIANTGPGVLEVASIGADAPGISVHPSSIQVLPDSEVEVQVRLSGERTGPLTGVLRLVSNDPAHPVVELPFLGEVRAPLVLTALPEALVAALPPRSARTRTKTLRLANPGSEVLEWSALTPAHVEVFPAAGALPPGGEADLSVTFSATNLDQGDHAASLTLLSDAGDSGLDVPLLLRVREVAPDRLDVDFSPRFSTGGDTVEVAVELPPEFAPGDIRIDSILLNECASVAAAPPVLADLDRDGVLELIVQFDTAAFEDCMPREGTDGIRSVTVVGEVRDLAWFAGTRYLRGVVQLP